MAENDLKLHRPEEYVTYASTDLSPEDLKTLTDYVAGGGYPLSPDTAARLFELFLNGSDARDIQRLNKAYPLGAILDSQIRYRWTEKKDTYANALQDRIREKVMNAQLETTELMTDLLAAARRRYSDKLKKYIQTGDEKDLGDIAAIDSLKDLLKISEGLLKITGQDRVKSVKTDNTQTMNVNLNAGKGASAGSLEPSEAAQILDIMSNAKKRVTGGGSDPAKT